MTRWQVTRLVAGREIRERVRSKAMRISTGVTMLIILAVAVLPGLVGDDGPTTYDVGVFGPRADQLAERLPVVAALSGEDVIFDVRPLPSMAEAERLVGDGDLDAAVGDNEVVVDEELGDRLGFLVQEANRQVVGESALAAAGVPPDVADRVLLPEPLPVRALDPPSEEETEREGLVFVGTMLLYGQLLGFGYWVASGVVEEKASRVVEILLAKAPATQLLAGKVAGIGVIGLAQLSAFMVVGLAAASLSGTIDLPSGIVPVAFQVVGWFVLGFAFYGGLFAVAGALASRAEELQSTTTPLTFVVIGSFFAAVSTGGDPGGSVAQIATYLPPSAPLVVPIRVAAHEVGVGTVILSVTIVLAGIAGVVGLAGRVYAGGALQFRGQLKLRAALAEGRQVEREPAA
ncbi:MAG TPA: ABC transporter permease [Acidimicrobiales bacterium]|nr:ABC transporter permease [Acidimicrobiales bacterium]